MSDTTAENGIDGVDAFDLDDDERYRLLADERRRRLVDVLSNRRGPTTLSEVATDLLARETGATGDGAEARLLAALHHKHLPMLAEAGLVEYDPERTRVDPHGSRLEAVTA